MTEEDQSRYADKGTLAFIAKLEQQLAASLAENLRLRKALENCRLLAARHRKEEWASHVLRFCDDAGVSGKVLRHNPPGDQSALREVIARVLEERGQAQRIGNADYGTDPYYLLIGNAAQLRSGKWAPECLK